MARGDSGTLARMPGPTLVRWAGNQYKTCGRSPAESKRLEDGQCCGGSLQLVAVCEVQAVSPGQDCPAHLPRDLAEKVPQAVFDIARLVEPSSHQRLDPVLGGGSPDRSDTCIPP